MDGDAVEEEGELEEEDEVELESLFAPLELESPPLSPPETPEVPLSPPEAPEAPLSCFPPSEALGLDRLGSFNLFE